MDRCCGLDIHKDSVFACILGSQGKKVFEQRFGTLTRDLTKLRDIMVDYSCGRATMESTSIYWIPVWRTLQSDFSLKLANPYFIKQLPGRKSDVKDGECLQKELIKGSFVPDEVIQQMRQYSRQYRRLSKSKARVEQQMDNQLQRCNIRLSNYVSNQGKNVSLRKVVNAIIGGIVEHEICSAIGCRGIKASTFVFTRCLRI
jgi:Transposase.